MRLPTIEILDPDGSYATLRPFDDIRARVLTSNVLGQGSVVHKPEALAWAEAAEDLGGFTRLGPSDFASDEGSRAEPAWETSELLAALDGDEDRPSREDGREVERLLAGIPASQPSEGKDTPDDQVRLLLGLVRHLRKAHEEGRAGSRRLTPCRCPGFGTPGGRLGKTLRTLIGRVMTVPWLPRMSPLLRALEKTLRETLAA